MNRKLPRFKTEQKPPPISEVELSHLALKTFFNSPEYDREAKDLMRERLTYAAICRLHRFEKRNQELSEENYKQWLEIEELKAKAKPKPKPRSATKN